MDIDKFLDKEAGDESSGSSDSSEPIEIHLSDKKDDFQSEIKSILANIRSYIKEQKLESVEKTYASLWTALTETNFKWDESLYQEIHQINELLDSEYAPLLEGFNNQVQVIRHMIRDGRQLVAENKISQALKLYHEVSAMAKELPNVSFSEKKAVEREVLRLYRDIHERVGLETIEKVRALNKQSVTLLSKLRPFIVAGNISKASEIHQHILELYNQIPFGFLSSKIRLGRELLESYKLIAIQMRIKDLRDELPLISQRMLGAHQLPVGKLKTGKYKTKQQRAKEAQQVGGDVQPIKQARPQVQSSQESQPTPNTRAPPAPEPQQTPSPQGVPTMPPPPIQEPLVDPTMSNSLQDIISQGKKQKSQKKEKKSQGIEEVRSSDPFDALSKV